MNIIGKYKLLLGASLAAVASISPASAQQASGEIVVTASGRAQALQDVPIAVTAIGEEQLQNAGITDVRALEQVAPSFRFVTGQSNAAGTTAYIRGLGTGADNVGFESAVGFFVDGVYRARPGVALSELPAIERVEVLRGPQGTLFGKNTTAGAISVTTAAPEFDWKRFAAISVGNYGFQSYTAGVTGPVVDDVLALRVEGNIQSRDGTIDNINGEDVNNRDRSFVRGQLLWDVNPDVSVRVIADVATTNEICCSAIIVKEGPTSAALNALTAPRPARPAFSRTERRVAVTPGRELQEDTDEKGISAQVDWAIGDLNFTSISSYRDWTAVRGQDIDFSGADRAYRAGQELGIESATQEFRLQGVNGKLDWLIGAFYSNETLNNVDRIRFGRDGAAYSDLVLGAVTSGLGLPPLGLYGAAGTRAFGGTITVPGPTTIQNPLTAALVAGIAAAPNGMGGTLGTATAQSIVNSYAALIAGSAPLPDQGQNADRWTVDSQAISVFTHNVISLTDKLDLTLGARYNQETKDLTGNLNATAATCNVLNSTTPIVGTITPAFITSQIQTDPTAAVALTVACNPVINSRANGLYAASRDDNEWNGTVSLAYSATEDLLLYTGFSRGYKSGGFNLERSGLDLSNFASQGQPSAAGLGFEPEFANAYEAGLKATVPAIAGTINAAVFYTQVEDFQLNAFNGFNFQNRNLGEVISQGVELEAVSRPIPSLTLQGAVVYNTVEVTKDKTSLINGVELGGRTLGNSPEFTVTGALTWDQPIAGTSLRSLVYVDGRYNTEHPIQSLGRDPGGSTDNDAFAIFNARIGIGAEDRSWSLEGFVRNLTDETYYLLGFQVPEQTGTFGAYPNDPRTYGVTFRTNF